jgi:hypothetical protein
MLEFRLKILKSKILHSFENNGNTKNKVFISNNARITQFLQVAVVVIHRYAVQGRDKLVRDSLSKGLFIQKRQ